MKYIRDIWNHTLSRQRSQTVGTGKTFSVQKHSLLEQSVNTLVANCRPGLVPLSPRRWCDSIFSVTYCSTSLYLQSCLNNEFLCSSLFLKKSNYNTSNSGLSRIFRTIWYEYEHRSFVIFENIINEKEPNSFIEIYRENMLQTQKIFFKNV